MAEAKHPDLTSFKALSFDCYGTLIDWETGVHTSLSYLTSQLPKDSPFNQDPPVHATNRFADISVELQKSNPTLLYNENLVETTTKLAAEMGVPAPDSIAEPMGNSPGTWKAFPDTIEALKKLKKRYKLIILSNVDNSNMAHTVTNQLGGVAFDATYTAQDIGNYKPNHANFQYLFGHARRDLGVDFDKGQLLHVARSIRADHVPAKELGLRSVWISRGSDRKPAGGLGGLVEGYEKNTNYEWRFDTLGEFADEVERQFAAKEE